LRSDSRSVFKVDGVCHITQSKVQDHDWHYADCWQQKCRKSVVDGQIDLARISFLGILVPESLSRSLGHITRNRNIAEMSLMSNWPFVGL